MTPAELAAYHFGQRRAYASKKVARRELTVEDAEARVRPWLHIAAMAGAQIDAVYEDHIQIFPYDRAGQSVQVPLAIRLTTPDRNAALAELARARDAAIDALPDPSDPGFSRASTIAHGLQNLAAYLGAPPYPCAQVAAGDSASKRPREQKEAA